MKTKLTNECIGPPYKLSCDFSNPSFDIPFRNKTFSRSAHISYWLLRHYKQHIVFLDDHSSPLHRNLRCYPMRPSPHRIAKVPISFARCKALEKPETTPHALHTVPNVPIRRYPKILNIPYHFHKNIKSSMLRLSIHFYIHMFPCVP